MKRFSTSNYCNYRETLLILLLLTIGIVGNDNGVNAQNIFAGNNIANSTNEQILYSNPQYFTLPKEQPFQNDDAPPPEAALTVVGLLFNLRSKLPEGREDSNANTIYITGFEFFTSMAGTVFYQLSSREGEYYDQQEGKDGGPGIGNWTSFDLISGGTAEGTGGCRLQGASAGGSSLFKPQIMNQAIERADNNTTTEVCPLTIIPKEDFITPTDTYPWTLRANSTRSFYITLASKHLLVMPGNSASSNSSFDTVVAASTPDLELYEGVAARTYPLHQDESDYYHDEPMGFIGKIYYHVEGRGEETDSPSMEPSSSYYPTNNVTETTMTETNNVTETNSTETNLTETTLTKASYPSIAPTPAPVTSPPTPKPTRRCRPGRPCPSPPSPKTANPTTSPLISSPYPTTIELMVYLENVPDRRMSEREEEEYVEVMTDFLQDNEDLIRNGVKTMNLEVFYHNLYREEEKGKGGRGSRGGIGANRGENTASSFTYNYNTQSRYTPKIYPTIYIMTKVEVLTKLPPHVAAFFLWDELRDHEMALMDIFNSKALFVSYFRDLTNITVEVVDGMSMPPTVSPTKFTVASSEELEDEEDEGVHKVNLLVYVGVALGCIWFFLTLCSFKEIFKHRRKGMEQKELKRQHETRRQSSVQHLPGRPGARRLSRFMALRRMTLLPKRKPSDVEATMRGAEADSGSDPSTAEETGRRPTQRSRPRVSFALA